MCVCGCVLHSHQQAEEDETKNFELTAEDLASNPLDVFDLVEKRGKG